MAWTIIFSSTLQGIHLDHLDKANKNLSWTGSQHNSNVTIKCVIFVVSLFFPPFVKEKMTLHPDPLAVLEGQNHIFLLVIPRKIF